MPHLGIKQPAVNESTDVTGTAVMLLPSGKDVETANQAANMALKTTKAGVVLRPQPHDNPNDPLNWPMWRRDLALAVIGFYSFIIGGMTPLLAPVMSELTVELHKPLDDLTYLVGSLMLGMGIGSLFFAPTAVIYGKRLIYLISQLVYLGGVIWGSQANSFGSLLGARIMAGIGGGPAESLPSASIAEIYFAHERAYRTGIYTLLLLGGKNLVPLVSGFVAHSCGWHWIFYILTIIAASIWVLTFWFVHETWWDRTPVPSKRSQHESELARQAREKTNRPSWSELRSTGVFKTEDSDTLAATDVPKEEPSLHTTASSHTAVERQPFLKNLAIYTGRKSSAKWYKVFLRPFVLYLYPPIAFSTLLYATSVVWLSVIAETISTIFAHPPYNFPTTSVGLLYIGNFLGGCMGSAIAGLISDRLVRIMSRRNGGIYEPEFRLIMVPLVMITVTIGLMGFGWATFVHDHWIVPAIFLGFLGFGTSLASTVAITYAIDSYRMFAAEALVSLNFAKNAMGFGFAIFVPRFFHSSGGRTSYIVYGSVEIFLCLWAIPLYIYGKKIRHYMDEHNLVNRLYE